MVEEALGRTWSWISDLPRHAIDTLPEELDGAAFLDRWGDTSDPVTEVDPATSYPVRAATGFGAHEHGRAQLARAQLQRGRIDGLGPLLAASHAAYTSMGLGHPAADAAVADVVSRPGVYGARSSGGGSGGTIVVVCQSGALDDIGGLIR
jgi:galactokinase